MEQLKPLLYSTAVVAGPVGTGVKLTILPLKGSSLRQDNSTIEASMFWTEAVMESLKHHLVRKKNILTTRNNTDAIFPVYKIK